MIIAEIGWNFLGSFSLAKKMINKAKESGVKVVKFQLWNPSKLIPGPWDYDGRRELYEKSYLDLKKFKKIYNYCKKINIEAFASVFNLESLEVLKKISKKYIKIPSVEAYNKKLILEALKNFKYVFVSTGALTNKEFKQLFFFKKFKNFIPLHCVTSYPLDLGNSNFKKFFILKKIFSQVGYSGHYKGVDDALYAMSHGASVIEKHFTINKNLPGRDNKFALLPNDIKLLVEYDKNVKIMKIDKKHNGVLDCEKDVYNNYRGRWGL